MHRSCFRSNSTRTTSMIDSDLLPEPPSNCRYTRQQRQKIKAFLDEKLYRNSPNDKLDLYHASVIALCMWLFHWPVFPVAKQYSNVLVPSTASIALRQFVEALFISHAETSLNNDGYFDRMISTGVQIDDDNLLVLPSSSSDWCQGLIQR